MITIAEKVVCCGCSACQQACPRQSITMQADEEGFLYPVVDKTTCIDCHLCEKVCPIANERPEKEKEQRGYVVQHRDEKVLRQSTSGGAFSAIATWVMEQGGVVFGAAYDENFVVHHRWVGNQEELYRFRNSKYAQSEIRNTFCEAKRFLDEGKLVLYSGTPCQLEGLLKFLKKPYECLLTVDVVCRACPSPLVFKKYLEMQRKRMGDAKITNVIFRDKYYGYGYSTMTIMTTGEKLYHEGIDTDPYLRAFFSEISIRPSCTECSFRKRYRNTDLTIWDCFDVADLSQEMNNERGATKVLAHSKRGRDVMQGISNSVIMKEILPERILTLGGVNEIDIKLTAHPLRASFFKDLNSRPPQEVFGMYFPIRMKQRVEKRVRILMYRIGLYHMVKKVYVRLIGRENIKR